MTSSTDEPMGSPIEDNKSQLVADIKDAVEEARSGKGRPAKEVFEEMKAKYGLDLE